MDEEIEDINEEFMFGHMAIGFFTPWFGLGFAVDFDGPEPGWTAILGPFQVWRRHRFPTTFGLINRPPMWASKDGEANEWF